MEEVQQLVTDLAARIEDRNVRSEMANSVCEQVSDRIHFIPVGAERIVTINAAVLFEEV